MNLIKINTENVYCLGDLHGSFLDIKYFVTSHDIKDSVLIFCGDIGMGFNKPEYYKQIFKKLNRKLKKQNVYVLFLRGNHDSPEDFNNELYKSSNIKTLEDYTIISINDEFNILCVGGAISIDRMSRKHQMTQQAFSYMRFHNSSFEEAIKEVPQLYWENEAPFFNRQKMNEIFENNIKINAVCSHTCPYFCEPRTKDGIKEWLKYDSTLEKDLDNERNTMTFIYNDLMENKHPIKKWCYGHFHYHNFEEINGIDFHLIDMDRNGRMDYVELYRKKDENIVS